MINIKENPIEEGVVITHKIATNEAIREKAKAYVKSMKDAVWLSGGIHWFIKENGTIYSVFSRSYEEVTEEEIEAIKAAHSTLLEQISMFKSTMKDETLYEKACTIINNDEDGKDGAAVSEAIVKALGFIPFPATFALMLRDIAYYKSRYSNDEVRDLCSNFLKETKNEQDEDNEESDPGTDA